MNFWRMQSFAIDHLIKSTRYALITPSISYAHFTANILFNKLTDYYRYHVKNFAEANSFFPLSNLVLSFYVKQKIIENLFYCLLLIQRT